MAKSILITGAMGFIGSGIVRHLNDKGIDHLILADDIGFSDRWKNLYQKRFKDLISKHAVFEYLSDHEKEIDAIIHLGACSDTTERDGDFLLENNTRYTIRLAKFAIKHGKRFIYASSAATYGDGHLGFSDNHSQLEQLKPLNLYGFSKHLVDLWLKNNALLDQVVGLKYFNVYGPNEYHKGSMASMILKMFPKVNQEGTVHLFSSSHPELFADGEQSRDFLYVKDAVKMTCQFLENDLTGIFNIGSGQATSWNRLAKALFTSLGKIPNIQYIPMPETLKKQYQNYTCADMEKSKQGNLILPSYNVEEAVCDYTNNYLLKDVAW